MTKKIVITTLVFTLILGNFVFVANSKVQAAGLQEALGDLIEKAQTEGAVKVSEKIAEQEAKRLENAKNLVGVVILAARNWVSTQETRLNNNSKVTAEQRSSIQAIFAETSTWIDSVETEVINATSVDEVKSIVVEAKTQWDDYKAQIRTAYANIWIAGGQQAIAKYQELSQGLRDIADKLTGNQVDSSHLEDLLDELADEVDESSEKLEEAIAHLETMKTATGTQALQEFISASALTMEAIGNLMNDASAKVGEIVTELRVLFS